MSALPKSVASSLISATEKCTFCPNLCLHACPVSTAEMSTTVAPWGKMLMARWLATGEARPTLEAIETLHHCTDCGACTDACVHGVPVGAVLRGAAADFAALGIQPVGPALFPAVVEVDASVPLPPGVSGAALLAAGHIAEFQRVARAAAARWSARSELTFESLIDLHCVGEHFASHGAPVAAALRSAASRPRADSSALAGVVGWFETCVAARSEHVDSAALRSVSQAAHPEPLKSLRWEGRQTTCCGAGGDYPVVSPAGAREAARRILQNAVDRGIETLVVPCAGCAGHLRRSAEGLPITVVTAGGH